MHALKFFGGIFIKVIIISIFIIIVIIIIIIIIIIVQYILFSNRGYTLGHIIDFLTYFRLETPKRVNGKHITKTCLFKYIENFTTKN